MVSRTWIAGVRPEWTVTVSGPPDVTGSGADVALRAATDAELVAACLEGRREAFAALVERHRRQVYRLCYRFAGTHEDASDLAQDVFVRAFRGLTGFKGQAAVSTWLYRIAVNVCLNHIAARAPRAVSIEGRDFADAGAQHPDAALLRAERAKEVRTAIAQLPPRQRATLILRVYHELPHDQIARILGSSVGAAKANFFHALANLKQLLRRRDRDGL